METRLDDPSDLDASTHPPRPLDQWPQPADFHRTIYEHRAAVQACSAVLLRLIALGLDLPEDYFDDRFVSTMHRVRNISGRGCYNLAYFFASSQDVMLRTVPTFVAEGETSKYEDVKAGDWQRERLLRARVNHPASITAKARGEI
ncbi:Uu.00g050180.m01.CDS01 [Anthostomella pinea]|uniref:Uu.00g050180.m01.CDS01 n=1 Tax=Anthostomella pinea TaxID=933095 RepID=A0AAI8VM09_9PEZI|nr:Uu.00g050180.m01.CDS01 [Anthostomella pinea]